MLIKRKFLSYLFVNTILLSILMSTSQISINAEDNTLTQENTDFEIGNIFRFQYDILRFNGSSKDVKITIYSKENITDDLVVKEGDILNIEISDISDISVEYGIQTISCWLSIEGSEQDKIKFEHTFTLRGKNTDFLHPVRSRPIYTFFGPSLNSSYYQDLVEIYDKGESERIFIENDMYCYYYDQSSAYELIYLMEQVYIPKGITSYLELKYTTEFSIPFHHMRIISLDYPPNYAIGEGLNIMKLITVNLAELVTDPFFYLILAELGGLLVLVMFLRKKGAF